MELAAADLSPAKAYHFLTHAVAPRPIAWVTSLGADGTINAAPFSWFQSICADPPMIMLAIVDKPGRRLKDTARNILANQEFVVNIARGSQLPDMVATSADLPANTSELDLRDLNTTPAMAVGPPRIAGCAAWLECRLVESHRYGAGNATTVVVGEVVHMAAADELVGPRGVLDPIAAGLPARLGGDHYIIVNQTSQHTRPQL